MARARKGRVAKADPADATPLVQAKGAAGKRAVPDKGKTQGTANSPRAAAPDLMEGDVIEVGTTGVFAPAGSGTAGKGGRFLLLSGQHQDEAGRTVVFEKGVNKVLDLDYDAEKLFPNKFKRVSKTGEELGVELASQNTQPHRDQFVTGQEVEEPESDEDDDEETEE